MHAICADDSVIRQSEHPAIKRGLKENIKAKTRNPYRKKVFGFFGEPLVSKRIELNTLENDRGHF